MQEPVITVILPAFNAEQFIKKAIESILAQTFSNFELIIINDGSTDNTDQVIRSFTDSRIKYIKNSENKGLIDTLNKGIDEAKGKYIARMDADDISLPTRFEIQVNYLNNHSDVDIVASTIIFINEKGEQTGTWPLDTKTINSNQITEALITENCIAHPSVMGKTAIFTKYRYRKGRVNIEDYDLWLRMINNGRTIAKIEEPLLLYRVHEQSITGTYLKKTNFYFKHARTKVNMLRHELLSSKWSWITFKIGVSAIKDCMKGFGKEIKKGI
jgi:glycosyltransferase involved in cell wall biosynthesis